MTVSVPMPELCRTGHTPIDALALDGRMFIGEPREVIRPLSVVLLLSNDANTAARRSKNYPNSAGAADLLKDILTLPLAQSVRQVQLYVLSGGRAWWGRIFSPETAVTRRWMRSECQTGLQRGCVTIARLMQMRCANFRRFFCNGFAQVSQAKTTDLRESTGVRSSLIRHKL